MRDDNISRAAVEGAVRARISYHSRAQANANRELGRCIGESDRARWRAEEAKHAMAKQAMETLFNEVSALTPAPVEGEGYAGGREYRWARYRHGDCDGWEPVQIVNARVFRIGVDGNAPMEAFELSGAALSQTPGGED